MATPLGQLHERGALTIALAACESGWRPLYFGPGQPVAEIAAAERLSDAKAVALSITNPSGPHRLKRELAKLRDFLSTNVSIFRDGQLAAGVADLCRSVDIVLLRAIDTFRQMLEILPD